MYQKCFSENFKKCFLFTKYLFLNLCSKTGFLKLKNAKIYVNRRVMKAERRRREGSRSNERGAGERQQRLNIPLRSINRHIELNFDRMENCNTFMKMHIDKLMLKTHLCIIMCLQHKSAFDIGMLLWRILNFFNLAIARSK